MSALGQRLAAVNVRIVAASAAAKRAEPVLIAVSKLQPIEAIVEAYQWGQRDFGENYVQELVEKAAALRERGITDVRWHFLGPLQTNKAKALCEVVDVVHAVDSVKVATELDKRWRQVGREGNLPFFLAVNIDAEPSKHGVMPEVVAEMSSEFAVLGALDWRGLMCIPHPDLTAGTTDAFRRLRELVESLGSQTARELSMGMTQDFEIAIAQGAHYVRVGTAIFGEREKRA